MAWVKIDDQFTDHPKAADAGPLGIAMQVAGLCYSNRHLTDGFISQKVAARLLDFTGIAIELPCRADPNDPHVSAMRVQWLTVCDDLTRAGLWEEVEGGWQIHDYLEYNPSRSETLTKRAADLERKRRPTGNENHSAQIPRGIPTDSKRPVPDPVPQKINSKKTGGDPVAGGVPPTPQPLAQPPTPAPKAPTTRAKGATPAPDSFPISDDMRAWADEHAPGVDVDRETDRFLDRNRASGTTYKDWAAAWRNWLTSPYAKPQQLHPNGRAPDLASVNGVAMSPRMARNLRVLQETEL